MRNLATALFSGILLVGGFMGCSRGGGTGKPAATSDKASPVVTFPKVEGKPRVAYVTNGIASFWVIAEKGANDAGEKLNVDVDVRMPPDGVGDQKRMIEELLVKKVDGIAVSPIDADGQSEFLREVGKKTRYITHDSDAPDSGRICYIGMDNYEAGRMCGKLVKQALPDGGSVILFIGRLGQDNAKRRRQGVIDEVLDRSSDPNRYDEPGQPLKGNKYEILDTRTDDFDYAKCKAQAQDAIVKYPKLGCMVGLFAYNPPQILEALEAAGKLKTIKVVGFDEDEVTLKGIQDGTVVGTIVQNPYKYGYESVRVLAALAKGDESVLPKDGFMNIPARSIMKDNVDAYWTELKKLTGKN